jgi:hypothetical protein
VWDGEYTYRLLHTLDRLIERLAPRRDGHPTTYMLLHLMMLQQNRFPSIRICLLEGFITLAPDHSVTVTY